MSRHTRKVTYETTMTGKDLADFARDVPLDAAIHFEAESAASYSYNSGSSERTTVHATWESQK